MLKTSQYNTFINIIFEITQVSLSQRFHSETLIYIHPVYLQYNTSKALQSDIYTHITFKFINLKNM